MRRIGIILIVALALCAGLPARAHPVGGRVRAAVVSPSVPRTLYRTAASSNGLTGYVFALSPGSNGKSYTLSLDDGLTGHEDLDAYFYTDIDGTGAVCPRSAQQQGTTETGTITCGPGRAAWAVVVLASGADARFTFTA